MPDLQSIRRVVLTGFMGAGKSTVGLLLAQELGWEFVDVDTAIELRAGKRVPEIFAQDGEAAFRVIEADAIRECCERQDVVVALGGGALEAESTRELVGRRERTCVVFLDAPLEVLVERCLAQASGAERPVLADRQKLLGRYQSRLAHYRKADVTVATAGRSPDEVVECILAEMKARGCKGDSLASRME